VRQLIHGLSAPAPQQGPFEVIGFTGGAFQENGYLLRCRVTGRFAVVDPGASVVAMIHHIERSGGEVEAILLTHAHIDHVEGIPALMERFPAPIYLHPGDGELYTGVRGQASLFGLRFDQELPAPSHPLASGESLSIGEGSLLVRAVPGHSPGHVLFYESEGGFALVGDLIFSGSIGRTDLPGGSLDELLDSIRREVLTLPDETVLLPGHGAETTVGRERGSNPFLLSPRSRG